MASILSLLYIVLQLNSSLEFCVHFSNRYLCVVNLHRVLPLPTVITNSLFDFGPHLFIMGVHNIISMVSCVAQTSNASTPLPETYEHNENKNQSLISAYILG